MSKLFVVIATMLLPTFALAHSGHGHIETTSIWHWLFEFDHIGWLVPAMVVLLMFVGRRLLHRNR